MRRRPLIVLTVLLAGFALALSAVLTTAFLLPVIQQAREAAKREETKENLRQLGVALQAYHERGPSPIEATAGAPRTDR